MKLNLDIINDYLPNDYECRKMGTSDRHLHLGRPLLYDAECEMEKDTLYIARADSLPRFLPSHPLSIICIGKPVRTEWSTECCQILQITNKNNLVKIFNDIQKIYDYFDAWDMRLRDTLEKSEPFDVKEILIAGSSVFENMITVCDHRLCVILDCKFQVKPNGNTSCFDYYFSYFEKAFHKYLQNLSQSESEPSTAIRKLYEHQPLSIEEKQFFTLSKDIPSLDFFENHILQYMLDQCSSEYSIQSLYTRNLWSLICYDQKKNTDYLHTLDIYLKNEMSITKTAADLYSHRSSMMRRIDKLHQLLNSNLSSPDERLYYRICLAIINSHPENKASG